MNKMTSLCIVIASIGIISGPAFSLLHAEEPKTEEKVTIVKKSVTGEVTGIMANFIGVSSGEKSATGAPREFAFNLNKDVKLEHKKSLNQIGVGDTVRIDYDEVTTEKPDGNKSSKRVVKAISFIRPAPLTQLMSQETEDTP